MRYDSAHKETSRLRILEAARHLFRSRGFEGASIDQVMAEAGLTRGAFYAHFRSKDDLVDQVLGIEAGLVESLRSAGAEDDPRGAAAQVLSNYLDPSERMDVATGCPLIAHPVDAIRGSAARRRGYTDRLEALIESLRSTLGEDSYDEAILVSVLAIGGGLLSAASANEELGDRLETVCLEAIESLMSADSDT
jgi:TetR/AcrR family transcriptional regulator, transcriptional repressor for nem operon